MTVIEFGEQNKNTTIPGNQLEILPGLCHGDLSINHPEQYVRMFKKWREEND